MTPEGKVKAKVKKLLKSFGNDCYYEMPVPGGFGKSGLDFNICFCGCWISIETKAPGQTLTDRQKLRATEIEAAGGMVWCIDGTDKHNPTQCYDIHNFSDLEASLQRIVHDRSKD
jgi:hypothetical protein